MKRNTLDEAGLLAVRISEKVKPALTAKEQALFIAGFQECIKLLGPVEGRQYVALEIKGGKTCKGMHPKTGEIVNGAELTMIDETVMWLPFDYISHDVRRLITDYNYILNQNPEYIPLSEIDWETGETRSLHKGCEKV